MSDAAALLVLDPGPFATIQDLGRPGYQRFGVSPSGAIDPVCLRLANALAGNPMDEAAIEFTLSGGLYECSAESCRIAVTGANVDVAIDGRPAGHGCALHLTRGQRLKIGPAGVGVRGYVAVEGGFDLAPVLGSRSTHVRSRLGGLDGRRLEPGDSLPLRRPAASASPLLALPGDFRPPLDGVIRIVFGPQDGKFSAAVRQEFAAARYVVSPGSDRMACRLDGPAIRHNGDFNIVSDATVNGSIQVTGAGEPIILLADRQTTGGYPKIATVIEPDVRLVAQRRPGQEIRFRKVGLEEAEDATARQKDVEAVMLARLEEAADAADLHSSVLLSKNLISGVVGEF